MRGGLGTIPRYNRRRQVLLRQRRQRGRRTILAGLTVIAVLATAFVTLRSVRLPRASARQSIPIEAGAHVTPTAAEPQAKGALPKVPTPAFASSGRVRMCLPFPRNKVTLIAYHQVYNNEALRIVPLPSLNKGAVKRGSKRRGRRETIVPQRRMFRSDRSGPADRAVDIGGKMNAPILSPVTGTVISVRRYMLYGQYPDVEVDIKPAANWRLKVMMFHMQSIKVRVGTRVECGITEIGRVRDLARYFQPQIAEYTRERGDHIHIQVKAR